MRFDWRGLVGGLSAALPTITAARANRRAAGDLEAGQQELLRRQQEADAMIGDEIGAIAASNPEGERRQSLADYTTAIARSRIEPNVNASIAPNLGGTQYKADAAAGNMRNAQELRRTSDLVSRIDAPGFQRQREGERANRTASNVRELGRQGDTAAFLARLRAGRRRPNPWVQLISSLGTQIAGNYEPGLKGKNPGPGAPKPK